MEHPQPWWESRGRAIGGRILPEARRAAFASSSQVSYGKVFAVGQWPWAHWNAELLLRMNRRSRGDSEIAAWPPIACKARPYDRGTEVGKSVWWVSFQKCSTYQSLLRQCLSLPRKGKNESVFHVHTTTDHPPHMLLYIDHPGDRKTVFTKFMSPPSPHFLFLRFILCGQPVPVGNFLSSPESGASPGFHRTAKNNRMAIFFPNVVFFLNIPILLIEWLTILWSTILLIHLEWLLSLLSPSSDTRETESDFLI